MAEPAVVTSGGSVRGLGPFSLYGRFVSQSIRSTLQYRLSFVLMTIGYFITSGVEALGVWASHLSFGFSSSPLNTDMRRLFSVNSLSQRTVFIADSPLIYSQVEHLSMNIDSGAMMDDDGNSFDQPRIVLTYSTGKT